MFILILGIVTVISLYLFYLKYQRRTWPPGPFPYPLIGNIIDVVKTDPDKPYNALHKLAEKYGNIYSFKLGVVDCVVVNGHKEIKEVQACEELSDRFNHEWLLDRCYGSDKYGLFFSAQNAWKNNRRFAQRTLKDVGFGKQKSMDDLILEEFQTLVEQLKDSIRANNGILHVDLTFNAAFVNIIVSFLTGVRFAQKDPKLHELVFLANEWFQSSNFGGSALGAFPFLKDWAPDLSGFTRNHRSNMKMLEYFTNLVNTYRDAGTYKTNPSNFIEVMLKRIDEGSKHDDYDEPIFTDRNLICLVMDVFAAGSETSANSTAFAVRHLLQEPGVQAKLQAEIDREVGRDRWVTLADRPKLKYTEATTLEILRVNTIAPIGPKRTGKDMKFGPYFFPKGTDFYINHYSGNNDKLVWGDPEKFRPERFLNEAGEIINAEKIASFAFGKRDCIGQNVAKSTLLMALACFAQNFTFGIDPKTGSPGYKNTKSITISPLPFNTLVTIR